MESIIIYLAYMAALALGIHAAYHGKVIQTCLMIGTGLEGASGPTGFQDAITPPETSRATGLNWAATFAVLAAAWWFGGVSGLLIALAVRAITSVSAGAVFNSDTWQAHRYKRIFTSMCRRQADYTKSGDTMRAEAMGDLVERFKRSDFADALS